VENGFCWVTLPLSGTAAIPADTFRDLFKATPSDELPTPTDQENEGSSFEQLTHPK
jgi:hypothetical protein